MGEGEIANVQYCILDLYKWIWDVDLFRNLNAVDIQSYRLSKYNVKVQGL